MQWIALLLTASSWLAGELPPKALFEKATAALASGDYESAERNFRAILVTNPNDTASLSNLGVIYSRTNRPAEAIRVYRQALARNGKEPGVLLNLGLVYLKQEDYPHAQPLFERVVQSAPANGQAIKLLATCKIYNGAPADAISSLEALRAASPRDEGLLYLLGVAYGKVKRPDDAKRLLSELLQSADPVKIDFLLGRASYDSGLFDDAALALRRVLALDPQFAGAHRELGKVLASQRDLDGSRTELETAFKLDSQDSEALYFLGAVLVQAGHSAEACPYLEESCKRQPGSWAAYYYLGRAKLGQGAIPEAVAALRHAVALNPDDASAEYALGRALQAGGKLLEAKAARARVQALRAAALQAEGKIVGAR